MKQQQFLKNLSTIHELFEKNQNFLNGLHEGVSSEGEQRDLLDSFLDTLKLEKNDESRYAATERIANKKWESLENFLKNTGVSKSERDDIFDASYTFVAEFYENMQAEMIAEIRSRELLSEWYQKIFEHTHEIGKLYSQLFVPWNRALMFELNPELEERFENDSDAILGFLEKEKLFDTSYGKGKAERCYSLLQKSGKKYTSVSYARAFPEEVQNIITAYDKSVEELKTLKDDVFSKHDAYINYYQALRDAWAEADPNKCVEKWDQVDKAWMQIDTPIQPGHPMEYYEDAYRQAVSIEYDLRVVDPSLFESDAKRSVQNMYEAMYDEIGRENFQKSYDFSKQNCERVQLYIGAPLLSYGSFLCGMYSAQVVPNSDRVSEQCGKKIFAFPKFVYEAQKSAPKMKLDYTMLSWEMLDEWREFLENDEKEYYEIYDIETIGHEFGHTLWLTPDGEVSMNQSGQLKNIEEFKATAGGLVAHFMKNEEIDEDFERKLILMHLIRAVKMMRYREVEDILPYYCECLIHMHIFFESGMIDVSAMGKLRYNFSTESYGALKELYTGVYTQEIFNYLNIMDAKEFLLSFVEKEDGIYLPKREDARNFVEKYYEKYLSIGNELYE